MPINPKTQLIKALKSLASSRSYGRLLENKKTGVSRDLFLPESDFKTSSALIFLKIYLSIYLKLTMTKR